MNGYSLGALVIAAGLVLACTLNHTCASESLPAVINMASVIVGGVFGLATAHKKEGKE